MIFVWIFSVVQTLVLAYAMWRGGAPERVAAAMLLIAGLATLALSMQRSYPFTTILWGLLWIDVALFVGLLILASFADRFWPLWLAALQLLSVANHGVRGYDHAIVATVYWLVATKIAYPMLLVLIFGTFRHSTRASAGLPEWAWTPQRRAYERSKHRRDRKRRD